MVQTRPWRWVLRILWPGLAVLSVVAGIIYVLHRDVINGLPLTPVEGRSGLATTFKTAAVASPERLERARRRADELGASAVVALHDGSMVAEWGATDRSMSGHSVRKSLVSALYGVAIDQGLVDTGRTLAELDMNDEPPMSDRDQQARLVDLLASRSGIYRASVKSDMERRRPAPGTHAPGTHFYYNNWSFNAAGGILERLTGRSLGELFSEWIAGPVGMQDFRPEDVRYYEGEESVFPAYRIWISARDLARVGQLYLDSGRWADRQIIPAEWVTASTQPRSELEGGFGYGFMWWTTPTAAYYASGTGVQMLYIDPERRLVVVHRVWTGEPGMPRALWFMLGPRVVEPQVRELADSIYAAVVGS